LPSRAIRAPHHDGVRTGRKGSPGPVGSETKTWRGARRLGDCSAMSPEQRLLVSSESARRERAWRARRL
jgi:hypothetical protein